MIAAPLDAALEMTTIVLSSAETASATLGRIATRVRKIANVLQATFAVRELAQPRHVHQMRAVMIPMRAPPTHAQMQAHVHPRVLTQQ